jgi:hypothetical protein
MSTPEINRYFYGLLAVMLIATCGAIFTFPFPIDWFLAGTGYQQALIYLPYVGVFIRNTDYNRTFPYAFRSRFVGVHFILLSG